MLQALLAAAVVTSAIFTIILLNLPSQYRGQNSERTSIQNGPGSQSASSVDVQILVLGDIGRSPRMQYHATSIAKHGGYVQLIGYCDSTPNPDVTTNPRISIIPLHSSPMAWQTSHKLLFLFYAPLKVLFQIWSLCIVLGYRTKPSKWMLIQSPPAIPTLAIAQIICFLRHTRLIIDWHNFGYSILALKLGSSHPMVQTSKWYEHMFSQGATAHFAVTNAMARVLRDEFHLHRAASLGAVLPLSEASDPILSGKTRLLVSSTSWTPDEDFSILLKALCIYTTKALTTHPHLPEILAIITGKGPQKAAYVSRIEQLETEGVLEMTRIRTAWLSIQDYATLLASADLGVSLHTSSSGVDLPMKVVDMFGAGLPVVGWDQFEAWPELVTEGVNGKGFSSVEGLVEHLIEMFGDDGAGLAKLKEGALQESRKRWDDEWDAVAGKLLELT
ncbi:hypothetical protein GJ744_007242 [Endocarpon pusillum]|uniref:Chitobiosyldiphosphodolichol beta-mannosyltransferase n=1 Tax=Endocarpon pusillum TaxID=364733 RepID=A0A8H7AIW7_9EURO|nr:hypothetical protein GJ744_007242 [Endocarpon pusillum]